MLLFSHRLCWSLARQCHGDRSSHHQRTPRSVILWNDRVERTVSLDTQPLASSIVDAQRSAITSSMSIPASWPRDRSMSGAFDPRSTWTSRWIMGWRNHALSPNRARGDSAKRSALCGEEFSRPTSTISVHASAVCRNGIYMAAVTAKAGTVPKMLSVARYTESFVHSTFCY